MKRVFACLLVLCALAPATRADDLADLIRGNNQFAVDLHGQLRLKKGNLFYSPFSISTALAMTSAGARGKTLEQMTDTLHLIGQKNLHPAVGDLLKDVNDPDRKGYQISVANALWGQKGHPFKKDFLDINKDHYEAGLELVDFKNAEVARKQINDWVEKATKEKIKDLIPTGVLDDLTRLVLTNAIYFKGDWAAQFKKDRTTDQDFFVAADTKVKVPLMYQAGKFGYMETGTIQGLEMPYVGEELSMVFLLPKKKDGLADLEKALTAEKLNDWFRDLRTQTVEVFVPRFKMTAEFRLKPTLSSMGMSLAFGDGADFSGMDGTKNLFIKDVIHKAFVDVNEKGTEAAAATGVIVATKSKPAPRIPVFRADHPFLFVIRDMKTKSIFFMGRLAEPTK